MCLLLLQQVSMCWCIRESACVGREVCLLSCRMVESYHGAAIGESLYV